jgi:hypothetical protein
MRRYVATWISVPAVWMSFQIPATAVASPPPLEAASAHQVNIAHPAGCLDAAPIRQTLEGWLLGFVVGPAREENPPVPATSFLFLVLDHPIAVCASVSDPAYESVTRIKITSLSDSDLLYVMHTWGGDEVRITSTLDSAATVYQEPGPVIFGDDFQFCWRHPSGRWKCMDSDAWSKRLPGPHLSWP